MNLERYTYFTEDYKDYEFYSTGPKGHIKKLVTFTRVPETDPAIYNLAFGDVNTKTGELDDAIITDNHDRDIILATVANTIVSFCNRYGDHYIYAEGSTPSRTRLYQISIGRLWEQISTDFEVYGLMKEKWYSFEPNSHNFEAFLVKRK
jgi:hypothetical protein